MAQAKEQAILQRVISMNTALLIFGLIAMFCAGVVAGVNLLEYIEANSLNPNCTKTYHKENNSLETDVWEIRCVP